MTSVCSPLNIILFLYHTITKAPAKKTEFFFESAGTHD
ncbi:hypothetical protein I656_03405 [Geobacillus sp. WSUCF1]|nr:hypothetical protein I656_03405 [Geobacillus sp. WSUCF1]